MKAADTAGRVAGDGGSGGHGGPRREGGPGGGGPGGPRRGKRQYFRKKKVCKFCVEKMDFIDYKRADILSQFVQERGKILPRRMTGVCSRHQRWLGVAIKRARNIALLPFAGSAAGTRSLGNRPRMLRPRQRIHRRLRLLRQLLLHPQQRQRHQPLRPNRPTFNAHHAGTATNHRSQRNSTCKSFFKKMSKSLGIAEMWSPSSPATRGIFFLPRKLAVEATAGN